LEKDDYLAVSQEGAVYGGVDLLIEPDQVVAIGPAYNNYVGTEWTMAKGSKVVVRQGDLVNVEAEVIVNPDNSELCHGGGAARAISVAAGKDLDDECKEYIRQFGSVKVGKVICTTAGNLKPRIKHVIYAVGPNAHENNYKQECFELVQSTVLCGLEYAEHVLNSALIAVPAISSGIFGVPKIDVAQALYQAILKFDETELRFMKTVQLVNLDRKVTDLINREFAWWFGGVSEMCVSTECSTTILQNSEARDRSQAQGTVENENMGAAHEEDI